MAGDHDETGVVLTEEQKRRRKARNVALAVALAVLVALFYVVTVFKMGGNVAQRTI
jgi:thiol:disulfide interchange protein